MSHSWIILLSIVAQAEAAPSSALHSPQLLPLPAAAMVEGLQTRDEGSGASGAAAPLPLAPRGSGQRTSLAEGTAAPSPGTSITTVISSLAIVLGLLFGITWVMRRAAPAGSQPLPSDVLQVLGRAMLGPRQPMQLVRLGDKLLLIAHSATGVQTLTEITERAEVERLAAACEAARGGSSTTTFRQVLSQLGNQPAVGGFFGREEVRRA